MRSIQIRSRTLKEKNFVMGGTTSSVEKVNRSLDRSEEVVNKVTEEGWRLFDINNTSTGGSPLATGILIIICSASAALCAWMVMWLVFHYQTCRKTSLEIRDERLRVETERLELEERRSARRKLRKEQLRTDEAETEAWLQEENAKTVQAQEERKALEKRPLWESSIWMTSPQSTSTPKTGHCSRCHNRTLESIV